MCYAFLKIILIPAYATSKEKHIKKSKTITLPNITAHLWILLITFWYYCTTDLPLTYLQVSHYNSPLKASTEEN